MRNVVKKAIYQALEMNLHLQDNNDTHTQDVCLFPY